MTEQVETKQVKWEDLEVAEDQTIKGTIADLDLASGPDESVIQLMQNTGCEFKVVAEVREDHGECIGIIDDPLIVDWQEDTMRVLRDLTIRAYGLTPADLEITPAEANERAIAIARDAQKIETEFSGAMEALEKAVDGFTEFIRRLTEIMQPVIAQIDAFWQAWNGYPRLREMWEAQTQIDLERQERARLLGEQIQRDLSKCWPKPMTPAPDVDVNRFRGLDEFIQDGVKMDGVDMHTGMLDLGEHTEEEMAAFRALLWLNSWNSEHFTACCTPSRIRLTGR